MKWLPWAMGLSVACGLFSVWVSLVSWQCYGLSALKVVFAGVGLGASVATLATSAATRLLCRLLNDANKLTREIAQREKVLVRLLANGHEFGDAAFLHFLHFVVTARFATGKDLTSADVQNLAERFTLQLQKSGIVVQSSSTGNPAAN